MVIFGTSAMILIPNQTLAVNCPAGQCPVASDSITGITIKPPSGSAPLSVNLSVTYSTTSSVRSVIWNFGDNPKSTTTTVTTTTHTYQSAGNFTGSVEIDFKDGQSDHQIFTVSVSGVRSSATATAPSRNGTAYQYLQQEHGTTSVVATSQPPLAVTTNSPTYAQGDSVVIHGAVKATELSNATALTVRIINPLKNLVSIAQFIPAPDGSFSKTILATGPLWTTAGNYTVIAQYGPATNASSSFYFSGGNGKSIINQLLNGTYALQAGQVMYNIPWTIQGGTIQNMQVMSSQSSLVITISSTSDGSLTVDLPRALIDSKQQPPTATGVNKTMSTQYNQAELPDQPFIVQINGQNVKASQTSDPNSRTLGIPFHKGDTAIYIIGTIAVPEFGPITALVLVIAIVSIIAISAKTGLRFMPRYHGRS
jgi:predicted secreted protein with PEFG-CTERM motif